MKEKVWREGWKVLREKNRKLFSAVAGTSGMFEVGLSYGSETEYFIGKETSPRPGNGPLAVFGSKIDAQKWRNISLLVNNSREGQMKLFRCLYVESREKSLYCCGDRAYRSGLPRATRFADEVIILRG